MFFMLLLMPIIQYLICNWSVWENTDLHIDLWYSKKNQNRLYNCLKEREDIINEK